MTMQVFELTVGGRHHRVETSVGDGWRNEATWSVDGEQVVATKPSSEDNLYLLPPKDHEHADVLGAVRVRFTVMSKPVRATWFEGGRDKASAASYLGAGGIDLVPEPGSPAALREDRMRANPRLYAARHVAGGVGKVVGPVIAFAILAWVLARVSWPDWDLPWPQLDLPTVPWPELPAISLPSLDLPDWVHWVLGKVKYVWPVLLGLVLARREISRHREQDALRARMGAGVGPTDSAVRDVPAGEAEDAEPEEDQPAAARDQ